MGRGLLFLLGVGCSLGFGSDFDYKNFTISYWCGLPPALTTKQTVQDIKNANFTDCGLNWDYDTEGNSRLISMCKESGLSAIVVDKRVTPDLPSKPNWKQTIKAVVDAYQHHENLIGYYVFDEPGSKKFSALRDISNEFLALDSKRLPYLNLFPNYASAEQLEAPTYWNYLKLFQTTVKPLVWSMDYYTFITEGRERSGYFQNLDQVSVFAHEEGKPFWNIILSYDHLFYRRPNMGEMRWQMYTSVAYGAMGIMHFTYAPVVSAFPESRKAIIDEFGGKTELYDIVQQTNGETLRLVQELKGYKFSGVFHTGKLPTGTRPVPKGFAWQFAPESEVVVAEFVQEGKKLWLFVNRNFKKVQQIRASFKGEGKYLNGYDPISGEKAKATLNQTNLLEIQPGAGLLLAVTN